MTLLILGLALWIVPHCMKRLAPEMRAGWGDKAKGPLSLAMVLGIVLMVVGYRRLIRKLPSANINRTRIISLKSCR